MNNTKDLEKIIGGLILSKKEGDYWDFKLKHHKNNARLVHDIICMSNLTSREGDRYIIWGVEDSTCEIEGLDKEDTRRVQTQIIDILKSTPFANENHPDIYLNTVTLEKKELDVLIIKDKPEKPYYLTKDYNNKQTEGKEVNLRAGTIYSRTRDSNTAINSVANSLEIEKMWKQRFGIDLTPLRRVSKYLTTKGGWEYSGEDIWHCKDFPEFTITTDHTILKHDYEWTRGEIGYSYSPKFEHGFYYCIKYYQTALTKVHAVQFDNDKKLVVAPKSRPFRDGGWIYYYLKNSVQYSFQCYLVLQNNGIDDSKNIRYSSALNKTGSFDITIFEDEQDLNNFLKPYAGEVTGDAYVAEHKQQNEIFYESIDCYKEYVSKKDKRSAV